MRNTRNLGRLVPWMVNVLHLFQENIDLSLTSIDSVGFEHYYTHRTSVHHNSRLLDEHSSALMLCFVYTEGFWHNSVAVAERWDCIASCLSIFEDRCYMLLFDRWEYIASCLNIFCDRSDIVLVGFERNSQVGFGHTVHVGSECIGKLGFVNTADFAHIERDLIANVVVLWVSLG